VDRRNILIREGKPYMVNDKVNGMVNHIAQNCLLFRKAKLYTHLVVIVVVVRWIGYRVASNMG